MRPLRTWPRFPLVMALVLTTAGCGGDGTTAAPVTVTETVTATKTVAVTQNAPVAAAGETPLGQAATECRVERNLLYEGKYLAMTVGQDNMEVEDLTCVLFALDAPREVLNSYVVEDLGDAKWGDYEASWRGDIYSRRLRITWTEP